MRFPSDPPCFAACGGCYAAYTTTGHLPGRCANMCSMRWDQLRVENEATRRLPGYRDEAVVRTFDAPEAMDVRFYEIHARSALNQVPKQSRMPFRWTINPYRGCTHACHYCTSGAT